MLLNGVWLYWQSTFLSISNLVDIYIFLNFQCLWLMLLWRYMFESYKRKITVTLFFKLCVCVFQFVFVSAVAHIGRRGCQIPLCWSSRQVPMWVRGIHLLSGRAVHTLNCRTLFAVLSYAGYAFISFGYCDRQNFPLDFRCWYYTCEYVILCIEKNFADVVFV